MRLLDALTTRALPSAVAAILIPATSFAAPPTDDAPIEDATHETRDVLHPAAIPDQARTPAAVVNFGSFTSVQANIDDAGLNIIGDAGNEPSIAVDPTAPNRLVVGWRQFDTTVSSFRQAGYSYSTDGGRTWAGKQVIEPGIFRTDPVLRAGPDGTIYYLSLIVDQQNQFLCDLFISGDGGVTWPTKAFAFGGDKAWFALDDEEVTLFQAWNTAGNEFFPNQFNRSFDSGLLWSDPIEYDPINEVRPVFGLVDVGPDGEVYVAGARNSSNSDQFWVVRSDTIGNPAGVPMFEQIVEVDMGGNLRLSTGPNPAGLLGQVTVCVDKSDGPRRGWVYVLCSVDPPSGDPMDVHMIRSEDGGLTWTDPIRVNGDPQLLLSYQWFGAMSVAPNGRLDVVWNGTQGALQPNISQLYYTSSDDGGDTWTEPVIVSPAFDSFVGWPNQNKLGDYYDIQSDLVGAHLIWAATFNDEQDVYYTRLGDYDCNGNGIGDATDLAKGAGDCDGNGIIDTCQIATGEFDDVNDNDIPDICECIADANDDGTVNVDDLLVVIAEWGDCPGCAGDLNADDVVDTDDLLIVLAGWGRCP